MRKTKGNRHGSYRFSLSDKFLPISLLKVLSWRAALPYVYFLVLKIRTLSSCSVSYAIHKIISAKIRSLARAFPVVVMTSVCCTAKRLTISF